MQKRCHRRSSQTVRCSCEEAQRKTKQTQIGQRCQKKRQSKSETTFLQKKKLSAQKAILKSNQSLSSSSPRTATATMEDLQLSAKGMKELQLQKKRRLGRAVEAAEHGYLLKTDDVGEQAFSDVAKKKCLAKPKTTNAWRQWRAEIQKKQTNVLHSHGISNPWVLERLGAMWDFDFWFFL